MTRLSEQPFAEPWLAQFDPSDRAIAAQVIDEILLIDADEHRRGLVKLLDDVRASRSDDRPMALYAERVVAREGGAKDGNILSLFPGTESGRATGPNLDPVPIDPKATGTGSEGIVANIITAYKRRYGDIILDHPGPDDLRDKKARQIVIVTDFIGSGGRVWNMLEALSKVATLRSWRSYGLIDVHVVAYSGTTFGVNYASSHWLKPTVRTVRACPTIASTFQEPHRSKVNRLCRAYPKRTRFPFGIGHVGALMAFQHSVPNNAPALLFHDKKWLPLFTKRSTVDAGEVFPGMLDGELTRRASRELQISDAATLLSDPKGRLWIKTMLVLTAIERGARSAQDISAQSRLSIDVIRDILLQTEISRWTSKNLRLTQVGRAELRRLRRRRARKPLLPSETDPYYYPTQLRAR